MKGKLLTILAILLVSVSAFAYDEVNIQDWTPYAYENITVTTSAVFRPTEAYRIASSATGALFLTVETNNINYRIDGGDPTSALGHAIVAELAQNLWLNDRSAIRNLRMIGVGGSALVKITYYRKK